MKRFKNIGELEMFYQAFQGRSLSDIYEYIEKKYPNISLTTNKGIVGQTLEALIGNAPNSDPNPDVKNINVELKVLPLRKLSNAIQPKERSKIKSINYNKIIDEVWVNSDVKNKMDRILFLLYEHPTGKTYKDWKEFIYFAFLRTCLKTYERIFYLNFFRLFFDFLRFIVPLWIEKNQKTGGKRFGKKTVIGFQTGS